MSEERIDSVRLQNLAYGYRQSATLVAAIEVDLFTKIAQGARTVEQVASSLDIAPINAERMLVACAALGLVVKNGAGYANAPDVERFLVKGAKNYAGPWLTTMGRSDYAAWNKLAEFLRRKEPPRILGTYENFTVEDARKLHRATFSVGMGAGRRFSAPRRSAGALMLRNQRAGGRASGWTTWPDWIGNSTSSVVTGWARLAAAAWKAEKQPRRPAASSA